MADMQWQFDNQTTFTSDLPSIIGAGIVKLSNQTLPEKIFLKLIAFHFSILYELGASYIKSSYHLS